MENVLKNFKIRETVHWNNSSIGEKKHWNFGDIGKNALK